MNTSALITAIMPTRGRPAQASEALACFLSQTWERKEIVILDDADNPSFPVPPICTRGTYVLLSTREAIGAKRNMACALANGELIAHWDDDDWSAPTRLQEQAERLRNPAYDVTGYRLMPFEDRGTGQQWIYEATGRYVIGSSLMYRRSYWQRKPFPERDQDGKPLLLGEDNSFVMAAAAKNLLDCVDGRGMMIASIHPGNTSERMLAKPPFRYLRMRLNLGSCDQTLTGYRGVDLCAGPGVDEVADLSERWPWPDNSVEEIRAHDVIEHLPSKIHTMNEAWRVLKPGGNFAIKVPTTDGPGAFQDPTHVSFWNRNSFLYFTESVPEHTRFAKSYGVQCAFRVVSENHRTWPNGVVDLNITLEAVKPEVT